MKDQSPENFPAVVKSFQVFESFAALLNLKIINIRQLEANDKYKALSLKAPFNRIYIVQKKEVIVKNSEQSWTLLPGHVYLIPLNSNFSCLYPKHLIKTYLHFRLELFPGQDIFDNTKECLELANYSQAKQKSLLEYFRSNTAVSFVHVKSIIMSWLTQVMISQKIGFEKDLKHYLKYQFIFDSFNADLNPNHSIASLAKKMNMSQSNFSKCFSRDIGLSPKAYLNKRLVEEAQNALILNDQAISKIAFELHFEDEHYFSRFFKKQTGFSPKAYREKHKDIK
ncbi:MAG: hypothetical protein COA79_14405 [Planctomycetota bacterium]|nr:MAG: hypothetical protein COA79_14405 [Planctomycetota bacterium]